MEEAPPVTSSPAIAEAAPGTSSPMPDVMTSSPWSSQPEIRYGSSQSDEFDSEEAGGPMSQLLLPPQPFRPQQPSQPLARRHLVFYDDNDNHLNVPSLEPEE